MRFVNYRDFVFETLKDERCSRELASHWLPTFDPSSAGNRNRRNEIEIKKERKIYVEKKKSEMK